VRVRDAVRAGELASAHDVAAGGWLVAAAESCLAGGIGAELAVPEGHDALDRLFGEGAGGFVVSGPEDVVARLGVVVGRVGGDALTLRAGEGGVTAWRLDELAAAPGRSARCSPDRPGGDRDGGRRERCAGVRRMRPGRRSGRRGHC
jgi:phosphoribosylformylglycinamidine synthase